MAEKIPLEKISRSFENNIQAIKVLNETIGCIADDHDRKIREEFEKNADKALKSFIDDIKAKHKDDKVAEGEEQKEQKEISEEEAKKVAEVLKNALFSSDDFRKAHKTLKRSAPKQGPILRRGALVSLLGCFETLIARLIREFYRKYPEAFPSDSKSLTLADLKEIGTIEDAELHLVDTEIDSILRGNISSQINYFIKPIKISIKPIEIFLDKLVEIAQRRNILVHNDGIINKHYLTKTPKDLIPEKAKEGCLVKVDQVYLSDAIETIYVVGMILIQQCFRKWEKGEIDKADSLLIESAFEALIDEKYDITVLIADYARNTKLATDSNLKIIIINHAIALRETGKIDELNNLIDGYDWSSVSLRFKLALHALKKDDDSFYDALEKTISAKEIECSELNEWPLFIPFQSTEKFQNVINKHWPDQTQCQSKDSSPATCDNPN